MLQFRMSEETHDRILNARRKKIEAMYPDNEICYYWDCLEYTEFCVINRTDLVVMRLYKD